VRFSAVGIKLLEISPEILRIRFVFDTHKHHGCAGNLRLRILDVVEELRFVPYDPRILICFRVFKIRNRSAMSSSQAIQYWTDLVLCFLANVMTGGALSELGLTGRKILR